MNPLIETVHRFLKSFFLKSNFNYYSLLSFNTDLKPLDDGPVIPFEDVFHSEYDTYFRSNSLYLVYQDKVEKEDEKIMAK